MMMPIWFAVSEAWRTVPLRSPPPVGLGQSPYILTRVKTADVDDDDDDDGHEVEENDHDDSSPQYVDSDHLHIKWDTLKIDK